MRIYLCRHGEAVPQAPSDSARELTANGHIDSLRIARQFAERKPEIDLALCSPYVRARQTADNLQSALGSLRFSDSDSLLPEADVNKLLSLLDDLAETTNVESVLLVGHNPLFSNLLSLLVDGQTHQRNMSTSNLASIVCRYVAPGFAELEYLLTP